MTDTCIVVLTAKSVERILREGGTSSWRLDRNHARQCQFAVCTRNANADWVEGPETHHSAFLIGKVSEVTFSPESRDRFLVLFSEFARLDIPNVWKGDRNPVKYATLSELGIDPAALDWEAMPERNLAAYEGAVAGAPAGAIPLTMAAAKQGLALTFGVSPEAVQITIRG